MTYEPVLLTAGLGFALLRVLTLLLLPTVPFAVVLASVDRLSPRRLALAPVLERAALVTGVLAAPLLLWAAGFAPLLDLHAVFAVGGPWDLTLRGFLGLVGVSLAASPWTLLGSLALGRTGPDIARASVLLGLAMAGLVLGPLFTQSWRAGIASALRHLILITWGSYATVYCVALLLWLANQLNFWCFLVLFGLTLLRRD